MSLCSSRGSESCVWQNDEDISHVLTSHVWQVRFWLWYSGMLPSGMTKSAFDMNGLAVELAASMAATYAVAAASYYLVEKPALALGRRLEPSALRQQSRHGGKMSARGTGPASRTSLRP